MRRRVLCLPGDGIGPEVIAEGRRVLDWLAERRGLDIEIEEAAFGVGAYETLGVPLPDETIAKAKESGCVLFGAAGGLENIPPEIRRGRGLLRLRQELGLYANLRPVRSYPALLEASSLKERVARGVDLLIVRELSHGVYFGQPRGIETLPSGERKAVDTQAYTAGEIRRVARMAFTLAKGRRAQVHSVDKSNVMETGRLWREEVTALHEAEFTDITLKHMLADNCAMQLVRDPRQFDVLVMDNLFGDLMSDGAAMIPGSLGMLPSASLGEVGADGRLPALYEPVHGSAPDIAGKGIANPLGAILSVAMLVRHSLGREDDAKLIEDAVAAALDAGARTGDIREAGLSTLSTRAMGKAVVDAMARLAG